MNLPFILTTASLLRITIQFFAMTLIPLTVYMFYVKERQRITLEKETAKTKAIKELRGRDLVVFESDAEMARLDAEYKQEIQKIQLQAALEELRVQMQIQKGEWSLKAQLAALDNARKLEEQVAKDNANLGSGGYIVVDMPETERPLFHDLLKGFEDYGRLKGYQIAFSIDSSMENRIAFKFTLKNTKSHVETESVRRDFKEFLEQVKNKDIDSLDNLPVIVSIEEHNLIIAHLRNRISFLQHNYNLSQTSIRYYEQMIANTSSSTAPQTPTVIVQNGNSMDSRRYVASNSQRLIQGDHNSFTDDSINIGKTMPERQERIIALKDVIDKLKTEPEPTEAVTKAMHELVKAHDELVDDLHPDESSLVKWLGKAKNLLKTGALTYDTIEAGRKLWEIFGLN